tara:strand:- start:1756 stop:2385 length:630 start_codon:yes stop_codon:yes gene_type:complete
MESPKGLIRFDRLDLCKPYKNQIKIITTLSIGVFIIGLMASALGGFNWLVIPISMTISTLIFLVFGLETLALVKTPLGVNINHPFIDDEPIGEAVVYVRFSNDEWHEMGQHRVRLVADNLIGGYNLVEDHEDYNSIGHFSKSSKKSRLTKQVIIINQALSLRDVVNGDEDPIDDARERETMDYGLLERDWLEEEELSVDGPLAKFINKE